MFISQFSSFFLLSWDVIVRLDDDDERKNVSIITIFLSYMRIVDSGSVFHQQKKMNLFFSAQNFLFSFLLMGQSIVTLCKTTTIESSKLLDECLIRRIRRIHAVYSSICASLTTVIRQYRTDLGKRWIYK